MAPRSARPATHREAVDEHSYPWSSLGKLTNETGGSCSGAVIARDKVLTAAHCVYNFRTRHYIAAERAALPGRLSTGTLFGPRPHRPLRDRPGLRSAALRPDLGIRLGGADRDRAAAGGYRAAAARSDARAERHQGRHGRLWPGPRLRAHRRPRLRTARRQIIGGRLLLHTCRGNFGSSGAPILVNSGDGEMQIAGIQIASLQSAGTEQMIAVPAEAILRQECRARVKFRMRAYVMPVLISPDGCPAGPSRDTPVTLESIRSLARWIGSRRFRSRCRRSRAASDRPPRALSRGCPVRSPSPSRMRSF